MSEANSVPAVTLPQLLACNAIAHGDRVALQERRYGIWQATRWAMYHTRVRHFAHGLAELGFERGEVLGILGDNRPEWLIAELAAQSLGGISLGIHPDGRPDEVGELLGRARVRIVVAEGQEQVDKLLAVRDRRVERIVYWDPRGLELYEDDGLVEFVELEHRGERREPQRRGWLDERVAAGDANDVAVLCGTAGTTGKPKLAMLSHRNLLATARSLAEVGSTGADDAVVSFLPLAWIGEQVTAVAWGLHSGFSLSFPEDSSTVQADLRAIGPRTILGPPRVWESLVSSVQVRVEDAGGLKRGCFRWGFAVGRRAAEARQCGKRLGLRLTLQHGLAEILALRPLREQLGLTRVRRAYTGGAPIGRDMLMFFHAIGINLKQVYGQTESCGIAVLHHDGDVRFDTVGTPLPGTELKIGRSGEILLRSPGVFQAYYRDEEATTEALAGGWLHTGDVGRLEGGQLVVVGRAGDVISDRDGTSVSPAFVESRLKLSPFVREAVVFGSDRPYVAAMISIDVANVGGWAERNRLRFGSYGDLAQRPEVYELISGAVAHANEELPPAFRVRRFVVLHKQLDPDDGELTRMWSVRRATIENRYARIVAALYDLSAESIAVTGVVAHEDGGADERALELRVQHMNGAAPPSHSEGARPAVEV